MISEEQKARLYSLSIKSINIQGETIMKYAGYLLSIGGLIALIITGVNYLNESESFSLLGLDVAVSKGDPVPMLISVIVLIAGVLVIRASKE